MSIGGFKNGRIIYGCDFPECPKLVEVKEDTQIACVHRGQVSAFCPEHAERLKKAGVLLTTLQDLTRWLNQSESERRECARDSREHAFIIARSLGI